MFNLKKTTTKTSFVLNRGSKIVSLVYRYSPSGNPLRLLILITCPYCLLFSPVAMSHLNGQKVFGKVMRVTLSKHQTVALPREGLDDQLLTKGKGLSAS